MKRKTKTIFRIVSYCLVLLVLAGSFMGCWYQNEQYNTTMRTEKIDNSALSGGSYDFGDISVTISTRGGDSGAWSRAASYDTDGSLLTPECVGTIYEVDVTNKSENILSDWNITIPINEDMWINNNWNSSIEIHQNVLGEESVMSIDLSDYSDYEITLDHFIDATGPMIPLYQGDYFIYQAQEVEDEKPIKAVTSDGEYSSARFGIIVYIPNHSTDYVADFSGGEINYYMYKNPTTQSWFKIILLLAFLWFVWGTFMFVLKLKMRSLIRQQNAQKAHDEAMVKQTMQLIINLIESKDVNTKGHSIRVAEIARQISEEMGLPEDDVRNVYYTGLMHDCGKMYIPDEILKHPGRLSDNEFDIMKKHTTYGAEILKDFTTVQGIDVGAKYHHERYDGTGYPSGLSGESIPLVARIIGVADAYDAMNSNRCYRKRLPADVIMSELINNKGRQFDPEVVDALIELIAKGEVKLSD